MFKKITNTYKEHPVQNSLMVLLLVAVGFLGYRTINPEKSTEVTKNTSNVVILHGDTSGYFIPEKMAEVAKTKNTSSISKPANKLNITLASSIYQYQGEDTLNASAGIRKSRIVSKKGSIYAFAAEPISYPAVYYIDYMTNNPKQIMELNTLTGERKTVLTEDYTITTLSFNSEKQALTYTIEKSAVQTQHNVDAKAYYLDTNKKDTIWSNIKNSGYGIYWSPNGKYLATYVPGDNTTIPGPPYSIQNTPPKIKLSDLSTGQSREINTPANSDSVFHWTSDSQKIMMRTWEDRVPVNSKLGWLGRPYQIDIQTGQGAAIQDQINDNQVVMYPTFIGDKLFSLTYDDMGKSGGLGWLSMFNMTDKTRKEYRTETSDYVQTDFLIDSQAKKFIFTPVTCLNPEQKPDGACTYSIKKIGYLNLKTNQVVDLPVPRLGQANGFKILGWNGNEDNIIIWDIYNNFYNINIITKEMTLI